MAAFNLASKMAAKLSFQSFLSSLVKPAEMTNLEYQDGGQSAFSINK